jgi:uncharacterized phage protein gp47/JayE
MELAAVATSEAERLKWVCVAIAWQDLAGELPDHRCVCASIRRTTTPRSRRFRKPQKFGEPIHT